MGLTTEATAEGIIRIANEHMAQALRVISVQRGHDPREFTLLCFGGAGGLHVCALAEQLAMTRAQVPAHGGVLSALGMLVAPQARQLSHSRIQRLQDCDITVLVADYARMRERLVEEMQLATELELEFEESVDLRYEGQSSTLNLAWQDDLTTLAQAFHAAHEAQFGHALDIEVELVNLRLRAVLQAEAFTLPLDFKRKPAEPCTLTSVLGLRDKVPVYNREDLGLEQMLAGPAVITAAVSTTWLAPGWRAVNDRVGNLLLSSGE